MPVVPAAKHKGHLTTINPLHYQIDIPRGRVRAGDPIHDPLASGYHPSGLMWYHTHPHGYARAQLNGGTSGFISVGGVCDNLTHDSHACREDNWNLHYIGLKDVQLDNKGVDAQGRPSFMFGKGYDIALCADDAARAKATGRTLKGECNGPGPKPGKWLFTLNGMLYPTIKTIPGKIDVWLMANMSPNVSYNLQLVRASDGVPQQVKVLAVDGVSTDQYTHRHRVHDAGQPGRDHAQPGSRRVHLPADGLLHGTGRMARRRSGEGRHRRAGSACGGVSSARGSKGFNRVRSLFPVIRARALAARLCSCGREGSLRQGRRAPCGLHLAAQGSEESVFQGNFRSVFGNPGTA